ncbi:MAG: LamB/YcsF family protein [Chthoniobacterales bacterium]|nr:MAG: LamB/YcsF family protein [Chthoniobacterales bacterium]
MRIDLNSDLGEGAGHDEEIMDLVSSANIASGFHAGTPASIFASIISAQKHGVAIGAHPSLGERENFGRSEMQVTPAEVFALMSYQLGAFQALCRAADAEMHHVKPHGALYNMSARDRGLADAIARAVLTIEPKLIVFAPPCSALEQAARDLNLQTAAEVFADRNYNADGSLVSRTRPDALLRDPDAAAERVIRMLREKKVRAINGTDVPISADTVCVHGDTPGAVDFARQLRNRLEADGSLIAPPK